MVAYWLAVYAFFLIGWDIWAFEAFNPFSDFTRQGLAYFLAKSHPPFWLSLIFLSLGVLLLRYLPSKKWGVAAIPSLAISLLLVLIPSFLFTEKIDLGMGSFIYLFSILALLGRAFAKRGWMQGDAFTLQTIFIFSSLILLFIVYPIFAILKTAFLSDETGGFQTFVTTIQNYGSLPQVFSNTLVLALLVSIISTLIGVSLALVVARSHQIKWKGLYKAFSTLPVITPPFVIGLSLIFLFGRAGWITHHFFGLESNYLIGLPGVALAQIVSFTPIAFMILLSQLEGIDPTLEEASFTLRGNYFLTFKNVTWRLLRPGLANAFLLTMMESFADFANPILIGGDFHVLSTEIYVSIIGQYNEQRAASLGIILLASTLLFFFIQKLWLGKKSYVTVTGKPQARVLPGLPPLLDKCLVTFSIFWILLTVGLYLFFFYGGFVKIWGIDSTFTLEHYQQFLTDGWDSFQTTLWLALLSAPLTAIIGLLIAYITQRKKFIGKQWMEILSLLSFAIPGTVIGIGYLLAFHNPPFSLTGSATILIFCFVFRNMPVGIRAGVALFSQIDPALEEASLTLRANTATTLRRILLPLAEGAVITAMTTSFIRAVTAISAVVFLVSAKYNLATKVILDRIEYGNLGVATAYSTILVAVMALVIWLSNIAIRSVSGRQKRRLTESMLLSERYA